MALATAVQGSTHTPQRITWTRADGTPQVLTGATLTGTICDGNDVVRAIAGVLTIVDPNAGTFDWTYGASDVATPGMYRVQFVATYQGPAVDRTYPAHWEVLPAQITDA